MLMAYLPQRWIVDGIVTLMLVYPSCCGLKTNFYGLDQVYHGLLAYPRLRSSCSRLRSRLCGLRFSLYVCNLAAIDYELQI